MQINTSVVVALMQLKGLNAETLSKIVHVPCSSLLQWLSSAEDNEDLISFESQLEVLTLLGIRQNSPRNDVVHYWKIHESLFSSEESSYAPLQVVLKAFGPAQATHVAREADPLLSLTARAHFALTLPEFTAILEVSAHPLRAISFNPGTMAELSWAPGTPEILLPEDQYLRLEPGSIKVRALTQSLTYSAEVTQWDSLRETAIEHGISAEQVASLLLGANPSVTKLAGTNPVGGRTKPSAEVPSVKKVHMPPPPLRKKESATDMFQDPVRGG